MQKAKVLVITKPDKSVHVVPVTHKAFYQHNNTLLPDGQKWSIKEVDEDEAKDLPMIDENFVTPLEAVEQTTSLKKQNAVLQARLDELLKRANGDLPLTHGQNGPVGHVGGDPATATEGAENTGNSFVPPAPVDEAEKSAHAATRVLLDQTKQDLDAKSKEASAKDEEIEALKKQLANQPAATPVKYSADEAIALISVAKSADRVNEIAKGDERVTVQNAAKDKLKELSGK